MISNTIRRLEARYREDPFARFLGVEVIHVEEGYTEATMTVREEMLNFLGLPHGGAIFSLADVAFAACSNSHNRMAVAMDIHLSYVAAAQVGQRLIATAKEEHLGGRTGLYRLRVKDEEGRLLASGQGLVYRRREALVEPE